MVISNKHLVSIGVCLTLLTLATPAFADTTIRCASNDYKYTYCPVKTYRDVRLVKQHSKTHCRKGRNWGYNRSGIWVDRGCDAEFAVASRSSHAAGAKTIRCASRDYKYKRCSTPTDGYVRLVNQHSETDCRKDRNWGYDDNGVWVNGGCDAEFRVGRGGDHRYDSGNDYRYGRNDDRHHDDDDNADAAIAVGAAIAGIAVIAALSGDSGDDAADVPSWAVGQFRGYDDYEDVDLRLRILPGGSVSGHAGDHRISGHLSGRHLQAGKHRFAIERSGNGFIARDEENQRHTVKLQHDGSGY